MTAPDMNLTPYVLPHPLPMPNQPDLGHIKIAVGIAAYDVRRLHAILGPAPSGHEFAIKREHADPGRLSLLHHVHQPVMAVPERARVDDICPLGDERSILFKNLNPGVRPVRYVNAADVVDTDVVEHPELTRPLACPAP